MVNKPTIPTKLTDLSDRTFSNISSRGEEYLEWGGPSHMGSLSPLSVALSEAHSVNLVAFINEKALTFEYSSDGGVTWTPYPSSIGNKSVFCTMTNGISLPIGRPNSNTDIIANKSKTRVTITALDGQNSYLYAKIKKMLLYVSTASAISLLVETRTGTNYNKNGAWDTVGTYSLGGWSGWNDIPLQITLGGYVGQTTNNYQLRLTASCPEISSLSSKEGKLLSLKLFGDTCWIPANSFGTEGKIYAFDINKNITFPSFVSASSFFEGGKNLEEKYLAKGTSSTNVNQIVYNPVEMKKALIVPSIQGIKSVDSSGNQKYLFELGGTDTPKLVGEGTLTLNRRQTNKWDSVSFSVDAIRYTNENGVTISYDITNGKTGTILTTGYLKRLSPKLFRHTIKIEGYSERTTGTALVCMLQIDSSLSRAVNSFVDLATVLGSINKETGEPGVQSSCMVSGGIVVGAGNLDYIFPLIRLETDGTVNHTVFVGLINEYPDLSEDVDSRYGHLSDYSTVTYIDSVTPVS